MEILGGEILENLLSKRAKRTLLDLYFCDILPEKHKKICWFRNFSLGTMLCLYQGVAIWSILE